MMNSETRRQQQMKKIINSKHLKIWAPKSMFCFIEVLGHPFCILQNPITRVLFPLFIRLKAWRNTFLPTFWAIGLHDCDSGGRVHAWIKGFAWNGWDRMKKEKEWHAASDCYASLVQISALSYFKTHSRWDRDDLC